MILRQMASYEVVEVYTAITDCTLHCRVLLFSCVERSHSYECEKSQQVDVRLVCSKVYLLYTCSVKFICILPVLCGCSSAQWITSPCRN